MLIPDCPKCTDTQTEEIVTAGRREYYCQTCSYSWPVPVAVSVPASSQRDRIATSDRGAIADAGTEKLRRRCADGTLPAIGRVSLTR